MEKYEKDRSDESIHLDSLRTFLQMCGLRSDLKDTELTALVEKARRGIPLTETEQRKIAPTNGCCPDEEQT